MIRKNTIISHFPMGGTPKPRIPAKAALSQMSWADISVVCKAGLAREYWQLGDAKTLETTGNPASIQMMIVGFDHDPVTDQTAYGREKAGMTLFCSDSIFSGAIHTSTYKRWSDCSTRLHFLPDVKVTFPEELTQAIVPVQKTYYDGTSRSVQTISDELFLLAECEARGRANSSLATEYNALEQYAYFAAGNPIPFSNTWWTRSYYPDGGIAIRRLNGADDSMKAVLASNTYLRPFAFCL